MDWREFRVADTSVQVAMPCRPATQARELPLAGRTVRLVLLACTESGQTFAVAWADLGDPAAVGAALRALAAGAAANLQATPAAAASAAVAGMTPHDAAVHWRLAGRRPDGQALAAEVVVFAHGTRVFQATWLGQAPGAATVFMQSLKVRA